MNTDIIAEMRFLMTKIDGLEFVFTKHMHKMIDKEIKSQIEKFMPEIVKRYQELLEQRNMEADQFNDGFLAARDGKPESAHPHYDFDTDNWRLGYAWGIFEPSKDNPKIKTSSDNNKPSDIEVSVTQDVLIDIKTGSKHISDLIALNNMADDNKKIFAFPISSNFKYARTGKSGWGEITIAIPNNMVANIDQYVMALYAADKDEFKQYKGDN